MSGVTDSGTTKRSIVYVRLLNEGTEVWRPSPARHLAGQDYQLLGPDGYDPEDEEWEFGPGSIVICEKLIKQGQEILAATRRRSGM